MLSSEIGIARLDTNEFWRAGFTVLRAAVDPASLRTLRLAVASSLRTLGWLATGTDDNELLPSVLRAEGSEGWWKASTALQSLELFHRIAYDGALLQSVEQLLGGKIFAHPRKAISLLFPTFTILPHQDLVIAQGTRNCITAWVPLPNDSFGDTADDSLRLMRFDPLEGDPLPLESGPLGGAGIAELPDNVEWFTPECKVGDAVLYHSLTPHALSPNCGHNVRLACEYRFQLVTSPVCLASLRPLHYPRVSGWWALTRGWSDRSWIKSPRRVPIVEYVLPEDIRQLHTALREVQG